MVIIDGHHRWSCAHLLRRAAVGRASCRVGLNAQALDERQFLSHESTTGSEVEAGNAGARNRAAGTAEGAAGAGAAGCAGFPEAEYTDCLARIEKFIGSVYTILDEAADPALTGDGGAAPSPEETAGGGRLCLEYAYPLNTQLYESLLGSSEAFDHDTGQISETGCP